MRYKTQYIRTANLFPNWDVIGEKNRPTRCVRRPYPLILFFSCFLAASFARQRFLHSLLLAGLQVEGVSLNLLDNVFLLHLTFKAAQRILEGLSLLNSHFGQRTTPPNPSRLDGDSYYKLLSSSQENIQISWPETPHFPHSNTRNAFF